MNALGENQDAVRGVLGGRAEALEGGGAEGDKAAGVAWAAGYGGLLYHFCPCLLLSASLSASAHLSVEPLPLPVSYSILRWVRCQQVARYWESPGQQAGSEVRPQGRRSPGTGRN